MTRRRAALRPVLRIAAALCALGCGGEQDEPNDASVGAPSGDAGSSGGGSGAGGAAPSEAGRGGEAGGGPVAGEAAVDEDGGAGVEALPIAELPAAFAQAICDALRGCLGEAALREITAREACVPRVTAELLATEFHYIDAALNSGHVLYDPSELPACLQGVRELGCHVISHSFPEPCVRVLAGNVALGGECAVSMECEGTAFCKGAASNECPSTCTELLQENEPCSADNECGDGMLCLAETCVRLSRDGEPCGGQSGLACALGYSCMGSTETEAGECTPNAEVQVGEAGDACEPGGELCKDGLSCVFDGAAGFHCVPYVTAGAACHLGLPGQCPTEQYCDAASVTQEGTCRALPTEDEPCVLEELCGPGHVCVLEADTPLCRRIRDNGEPCSADAACRSRHCVEGHCEPPPACDL